MQELPEEAQGPHAVLGSGTGRVREEVRCSGG